MTRLAKPDNDKMYQYGNHLTPGLTEVRSTLPSSPPLVERLWVRLRRGPALNTA